MTARLTGDQLAAEWDDRAQELRGRAADRDATEMPEDEGAAVILRACADLLGGCAAELRHRGPQ